MFDMTNIMNSPDRIPFYSTISFEQSSKLLKSNPSCHAFSMHLIHELVMNDNIDIALTVDASVVKDYFKKTAWTKHFKYLVEANIIKKIGSNKSWDYMINPCFAHKLKFKQQEEYRARYGLMFGNIAID